MSLRPWSLPWSKASCRSLRRSASTQSAVKGNVLDELESRGLVAASTRYLPGLSRSYIELSLWGGRGADSTHSPTLRDHVRNPSCIYAGIDPSAPSLHVGNLLPLIGLLHFHLAGHQAIALVGGATGSIGDPSGKSTERPSLSPQDLQTNVEGITRQVQQFFEKGEALAAKQAQRPYEEVVGTAGTSGSNPSGRHGEIISKGQGGEVKVLNNLDWFKDVSLLDFLRTTGKKARVGAMLSKESVRARLSSESGISFTEFTYQLLQAHDFATLYDQHGCKIQLGGSDQWGNIVAGIDLIKRQKQDQAASTTSSSSSEPMSEEKASQDRTEDCFGITMPLLTTAQGEKFGKSAGNAVWLDPKRTPVSEFYQFFFRQPDTNVEQYLKVLTLLPTPYITRIMEDHRNLPKDRLPQQVLARQVTELVHGHEAVDRSLRMAELLFRTPLSEWNSKEVARVFEDEPAFKRLQWADIENTPVNVIMATYGLSASKSAASKAITQGIITINDRKIQDAKDNLDRSRDLLDEHLVVIRSGKKDHLILYVE